MPDAPRALLVIDVQNGFCPGGALAVPEGDAIVAGINAAMADYDYVILTQDWHPAGHSSFASSHPGRDPYDVVTMPYGDQVLWPDHCIQGSEGAAFHADLHADRAQAVIRKGYRSEIDSYSAFPPPPPLLENDRTTPTGLEGLLRTLGVEEVALAGLALDFCVNFSAQDAARLGFAATVLEDLTRAIDLNGSRAAAVDAMRGAGVRVT